MTTDAEGWDKVGLGIEGKNERWTRDALDAFLVELKARFFVPIESARLSDDRRILLAAEPMLRSWQRLRHAVTIETPADSGLALHVQPTIGLALYVTRDAFQRIGGDPLLDLMKSLASRLATFQYVQGTAVGQLIGLWKAHGWPRLPGCFNGELVWWQALSPARYGRSYTRESLLATPARRVEEWPDGTISLQMYDDPFDWGTPETLAQLEKAVRHLDAHRLTPRTS